MTDPRDLLARADLQYRIGGDINYDPALDEIARRICYGPYAR